MYLERAGPGQLPSVFLFALPILFLIVLFRKNLRDLWEELKKHPLAWIRWGSVAGIGFYSLLSFAAVFSPAWLVAGTWQVTILAGLLLSPLFFVKIETKSGTKLVRGKIPLRSLYVALFILLGVICMQATAAGHITMTQFISGFFTCRSSSLLISIRQPKNDGTCWRTS